MRMYILFKLKDDPINTSDSLWNCWKEIGPSIPIKDLAFVLYLSIWNVNFFKRVGEFWEWNCDIHKRTNYSFQNLLYIKDIIILPLKSCICICAETTFLWEFNFRFFQVLFLQQCTVGCRSQKLDAITNFLIKLFLPYAFEELS